MPVAEHRYRTLARGDRELRRVAVDVGVLRVRQHPTLLHDDVVDESQLRRGLASANAVFGNKASVLVGDFLFARAFQLMVDDGSLRVLAILSQAAATIAEGEVLQLVTQNVTVGASLVVNRGPTVFNGGIQVRPLFSFLFSS